jgi:hypothetical protein
VPNYLKLAGESALSIFGLRGIYEQPRYAVVERLGGGAEVRRYAARLAAETSVDAANARDGRNRAFGLLAGYIFGANRERAEIAMTSPVDTSRSREIAMTSPVETAGLGEGPGRYTQRFYLPTRLTAAMAPVPNDPRVRILEVPEEMVAALRFGGLAGDSVVAARRRELMDALAGSRWAAAGEVATLFYDPPFTIPLLRRNEVAVRVSPRSEAGGA